jgi:hypothetical protein
MSNRAVANKVKDKFLSDYHRFRSALSEESKTAYDKILLTCSTAKRPLRHDELINLTSVIKYFENLPDGAGLQKIADFGVLDANQAHMLIQK